MIESEQPKESDELNQEIVESLTQRIKSDDKAEALNAVEEYSRITDETDFFIEGDDEAIACVRKALNGTAQMIFKLRQSIEPVLNSRGFNGTYPHFRRTQQSQIETLSFDFHKWGGSFAVEIGRCPPHGFQVKHGLVPPKNVTTWHLSHRNRFRLGSGFKERIPHRLNPRGRWHDHWISYADDDKKIDEPRLDCAITEVLLLLEQEAEKWWQRDPDFLENREWPKAS